MADSARPTARLPFSGGRPPHLPCGPGDVAEDVLVPGDPDRVALLRDMLTDVQDFGRKREFALATKRAQKQERLDKATDKLLPGGEFSRLLREKPALKSPVARRTRRHLSRLKKRLGLA